MAKNNKQSSLIEGLKNTNLTLDDFEKYKKIAIDFDEVIKKNPNISLDLSKLSEISDFEDFSKSLTSMETFLKKIKSQKKNEITQEHLDKNLIFYNNIVGLINPVLRSFLSSSTLKEQKILLVLSAICFIIGKELFKLENITIEKTVFNPASSWTIPFTITIATFYYFVVYGLNYYKDRLKHEVKYSSYAEMKFTKDIISHLQNQILENYSQLIPKLEELKPKIQHCKSYSEISRDDYILFMSLLKDFLLTFENSAISKDNADEMQIIFKNAQRIVVIDEYTNLKIPLLFSLISIYFGISLTYNLACSTDCFVNNFFNSIVVFFTKMYCFAI